MKNERDWDICACPFENYPEQLELLLSNGLFIRKGNKVAVNPGKILLLNEILMPFIPPMLG